MTELHPSLPFKMGGEFHRFCMLMQCVLKNENIVQVMLKSLRVSCRMTYALCSGMRIVPVYRTFFKTHS